VAREPPCAEHRAKISAHVLQNRRYNSPSHGDSSLLHSHRASSSPSRMITDSARSSAPSSARRISMRHSSCWRRLAVRLALSRSLTPAQS